MNRRSVFPKSQDPWGIWTRRHFLAESALGLGKVALLSLMSGGAARAVAPAEPRPDLRSNPLAPRPPHFAPRAKRVIFLFMAGGPSQLDLYDWKPKLAELEGQPLPASAIGDQRYAFISKNAAVLAPRFTFSQYGQSGATISSVLPRLAGVADDVCFIKSVTTDAFNHAPGQILLNTGSPRLGRPSMGSWVTYGIGSEANDLPGFVVLSTGRGTAGGTSNWSSGFLPTVYQGVPLRSSGAPILNVASPPGVDERIQRDTIDLVSDLNARHLGEWGDPEIATRIQSYELAYRMQSSAPELMDWSNESPETIALYGARRGDESFANNCLLARRLVERGVRFVNVYHNGWDSHTDVYGELRRLARQTDRAAAALVTDLKQRGLLDETLVVWGGEFGRTPMVESNASLGRNLGRDHQPQSFTMWMAGGGVKAGMTLGATDELGLHVVEDRVHVHDLQATILHLLGLDHTRLTYRLSGRDFRLTDVAGEVVTKILA